MNLIYFIRLLLRHLLLLVVVPITLAAMVFYFTKDEPKAYVSSTTLYTGITTGSSIVSLESSKVDLFATNSAFDNLINIIKARSTIEEVGMRLLATHLMLEKSNSEIISYESFQKLKTMVPDEVKALVVEGNIEKTVENFTKYKDSSFNNFIYELINYNNPHYSSEAISSKIKVRRVQSSDLISITYNSNDAGICKGTLEILTDVFIQQYANIKVNQSDAVVKYFEGQLDLSNIKLNEAEDELLNFNRKNIIINYYEQTKHVAAEKEHFEMRYLELKFMHAGAISAIATLEDKMSARQKQRLNNQDITNGREELSKLNLAISMKSLEQLVDTTKEDQLVAEIGELRNKSFEVEQELKRKVEEQYSIDNSTDGVPTQSMLEDWIDKVIELETSKAQITVAKYEEKQFVTLYKKYAPLGANMKRLERKIDVAEREYLSLLHSLGIAKLKQQNVELTSNLRVVTHPLFPIVSQPSKRKFLILIAFMMGFILPASVIIILEFLDQNLKTAVRAEKMIGLQVAAMFPKLIKVNKKLDLDFIKERGLEIIARRLLLNTSRKEHPEKPEIHLLFSVLDGEGKTLIASYLLARLAEIGYKVLFLSPHADIEISGIDFKLYTPDNSFHKVVQIDDLNADFEGVELASYDYIFVELPGILKNSYPINLFKNSEQSFLITRANRAWTKSDISALKDIVDYTDKNKPQVILNGVEMLEMETVIGDLPRKRSFLRRLAKDIFQLRFYSKRELKT